MTDREVDIHAAAFFDGSQDHSERSSSDGAGRVGVGSKVLPSLEKRRVGQVTESNGDESRDYTNPLWK